MGAKPYGLAADPATGWVFVTLTGANQLIGLRFAGASVRQRLSWPTGRQPNSVAVDSHNGLLAVTATGTDQVELIPTSAAA